MDYLDKGKLFLSMFELIILFSESESIQKVVRIGAIDYEPS